MSVLSARDDSTIVSFSSFNNSEKLQAIASGDYIYLILYDFREKNFDEAAEALEYVIAYAIDTWLNEKIVTNPLQIISKLFGTLIECYAELESWEDMRRTSVEYLRNFPELVSPYSSLAWSLWKLQRHDECIGTCSTGIRRFPATCETLYHIRASTYYDKKMFRLATKDFHKAIEVSKLNSGASAGAGNALKPWCSYRHR
jgi:tetratricopeptide (TPR) repeat protein